MLGVTLDVGEYVRRIQTELDRVDKDEIRRMADFIFEAWENGRFVYIFGNGGSGTTASASSPSPSPKSRSEIFAGSVRAYSHDGP